MATTSIVGDVVKQVAGDVVDLTILMPVGTDPHDYQPRPQDAAAIASAQIIFSSGVGLETYLQPLLDSTGAKGILIEVSAGISILQLPGATQASGDPHTWMDPNNVITWAQNISAALSAADPAQACNFSGKCRNLFCFVALLGFLDPYRSV